MRTDSLIKREGFKALFEKLDIIEAERFIALIKREDFDYTEWRKGLWEDRTVDKLSSEAMEYHKTKKKL